METNCFDVWINELHKHGVDIARLTDKSITLQDERGRKVRLNRLFSRLKSADDINNHILSRRTKIMAKQEQEKQRVEQKKQQTLRDGVSGIASQTAHGAVGLAQAAGREDPAAVFLAGASSVATLAVSIAKILSTMKSLRTPSLDADPSISPERKVAQKLYIALNKQHGEQAWQVYTAAVGNDAVVQAVSEQEGCDATKLKEHLKNDAAEIVHMREEPTSKTIVETAGGDRRTGVDRRADGIIDVSGGGIGTVVADTHRPHPEPAAEEVARLKKEKLALQEQIDAAASKALTNREFGKILVGKGVSMDIKEDTIVFSQGGSSIEVSGKEIGLQICKNAETVKAEAAKLEEMQKKHGLSLLEVLPRLGEKLAKESTVSLKITEGRVPPLTPGNGR